MSSSDMINSYHFSPYIRVPKKSKYEVLLRGNTYSDWHSIIHNKLLIISINKETILYIGPTIPATSKGANAYVNMPEIRNVSTAKAIRIEYFKNINNIWSFGIFYKAVLFMEPCGTVIIIIL